MSAAEALRILPGGRNELEVNTTLWRRFQGVAPDEIIEVTSFVPGRRPWVGYARTVGEQIDMLRRAQDVRGFAGAYLLVNRILPEIADRYPRGYYGLADNGRASDKEITHRRAVFIDVDPVRPKGISSTDDQLRAAYEVSAMMEDWLAGIVGPRAIGHGCSGNGFYTLIAIGPVAIATDQNERIREFLTLLNRKFGTEHVKIDSTVHNPARLMPAAGTWKRKGADTPERPHRMTSFCCRAQIERVPLEEIC